MEAINQSETPVVSNQAKADSLLAPKVFRQKLSKKQIKQKNQKKSKPFAAIELQTIKGEAWMFLNYMARHVYNTLKTFYKGEAKPFKAPFSEIKERSGIKHGRTISRAIKELEDKAWLEVVRYAKHGRGRGLRVRANEYRLTFRHDQVRW